MKKLFVLMVCVLFAAHAQAQNEKQGLKSLSECEGDAPEGIDVYAGENEEGMAILSIFKNAMPVQTMKVGYVNVNRYGGDISFVHYADVNFDGHTDILIGMDAPRNYITPIIYNPQTAKYDYQGDDITMQQPIFDMDNKRHSSISRSLCRQEKVSRRKKCSVSLATQFLSTRTATRNSVLSSNMRKST